MGEIVKRDKARTNSERLLLKHSKKSLREISEITGIAVDQVQDKLNAMLDSKDWLTIRRQEVLLIEEMTDIISEARKRMENTSDEYYANIAMVALRGITSVAERLDAQRKAVNIDISKITEGNARVFGRAFDLALDHIVREVETRHALDHHWLIELRREGLVQAVQYLEDHTLEEED